MDMDAKPFWGRLIRAIRASFGRHHRRRSSLGFATTGLAAEDSRFAFGIFQ